MGLLMVVLSTIYWLVNQQNLASAEKKILNDLEVTSHAFEELLHNRTQSLFDIVRPATKDFAFSRTYAVGDVPTLVSAMNNITKRIYHVTADAMLILDRQGKPIASTRDALAQQSWQSFIRQAEQDEYFEASKLMVFEGQVYQFIISPLLLPDHEAWTILGFPINENFAKDVKRVTGRDLSVITIKNQQYHIVASSHDAQKRQLVSQQLNSQIYKLNKKSIESLQDERFVSLLKPLGTKKPLEKKSLADISQPLDTNKQLAKQLANKPATKNNLQTAILLQGSYDDELKPYERLNQILLGVFIASLLLCLMIILALARSISRPLEMLTDSVRTIRQGDYNIRSNIQRNDEIGVLAESVNHMAVGLKEKEQVRNLLGKVVSDDIANELLSKKLELGGEEKVVTVLFSDVRNFTHLCEGVAPSKILLRLNRYFDVTAEAIESEGGVVDKYIGDAIMALFGAPVHYDDAPQRALKATMKMLEALQTLNQQFIQEGIAPLHIGVGINTGRVVVGNMGSKNRLNYTVIGDAVNLASRLEGLTKVYGLNVIISEFTMRACPDYYCREIDIVQVKGKNKPVKIYTPICLQSAMTEAQQRIETAFTQALQAYQKQHWQISLDAFNDLLTQSVKNTQLKIHQSLVSLYIERCQYFIQCPPDESWNGVYKFITKGN